MRFFLFWVIMSFSVLDVSESMATQSAHSIHDNTIVYQSPMRSSTQVAVLNQGTAVETSSYIFKGLEGEYWYKVRINSNQYGYVLADDLNTSTLQNELKAAGIGTKVDEIGPTSGPWNFLIRAMGLADYLPDGGPLGFTSGGSVTSVFGVGGEGEFSVCIPFADHGFFHRFFALGTSFSVLPTQNVLSLSAILRMYQESRFEPELRLRVGDDLTSGLMMTGLNLGVSYPFSYYYGTHVSGVFEVGSLLAVTNPLVLHVWASVGLGLHF